MTQIDKARLENFLDKQDWYESAVLLAQDGDIGRLREVLAQTWQSGNARGYTEGYQKGQSYGFNEGYNEGYSNGFEDGESSNS